MVKVFFRLMTNVLYIGFVKDLQRLRELTENQTTYREPVDLQRLRELAENQTTYR